MRELEVLRALMDAGSATAAAEVLHVTQPAISKTLAQIERRLGFDCFMRERGRLVPTLEGRALLPEILRALSGVEAVSRLAADLRSSRTGFLSIASVPSVAGSLLPEVVHAFRRCRPDVGLSLATTTNHEVLRLVVGNDVDFGFVLLPTVDRGTASRDLCSTDLVCVMPRGHPLARKAYVEARDASGFPLISLGRDRPVRVLVEEAFSRSGVPHSVAIEVTQSATALALIRAGAGIAIMDGFTMTGTAHEGLESRPYAPSVGMTCRLVWSRSQPLSRLSLAFVDHLDRVLAAHPIFGR